MNHLLVDIKRNLPGFSLAVQLEVRDRRLSLLGASGCGKSMTLRCIAGIDTPDEGIIMLNGKTLFDSKKKINLPPQKRRAGYLFQSYALFPHMTVAQNILIPLGRVPKAEGQKVLDQYSQLLQLDGLLGRYPGELSGGQQQRVALARVLCWEPDILMLDEPFSALDSYLRWQLEPQFLSILDAYQGITLYVSHNRDESYRLCDDIAVMDQGDILVIGDKQSVFKHPQCRAAAQLTGCKNISAAKKTGPNSLFASDWGLPLESSIPVPDGLQFVGFRAHDFAPCSANHLNTIPLKNAQVSQAPFAITVMLPTAGGTDLRWELDRSQWPEYESNGLPQAVLLPADKLLLLER